MDIIMDLSNALYNEVKSAHIKYGNYRLGSQTFLYAVHNKDDNNSTKNIIL